MQSRDGFMRFVERYPTLSGPIQNNIYAVPRYESTMDFATYRLIMTATGVEFSEMSTAPIELQHIAGMLATQERVLMLSRSRDYFKNKLGKLLHLDHPVEAVEKGDREILVNGQKYDYMIDATWGHFLKPQIEVYYEPTILLYYEGPLGFPALTMVDGPLCSVYPTEDPAIFTLSSVVHTPLGHYRTSGEARARLQQVDGATVAEKMALMEEQICYYYPSFREEFRFIGPQLSIKTKPIGNYDDRSCSVTQDGRAFSVMSGKIDTIFTATERILSLLEMDSDDAATGPTLRDDIKSYVE